MKQQSKNKRLMQKKAAALSFFVTLALMLMTNASIVAGVAAVSGTQTEDESGQQLTPQEQRAYNTLTNQGYTVLGFYTSSNGTRMVVYTHEPSGAMFEDPVESIAPCEDIAF